MKNLTLLILTICAISTTLFAQEKGTFIDKRDGHEYKWIKIGEQIWMAENLAFLPSVNVPPSYSDTVPHFYVAMLEISDHTKAIEHPNYIVSGVQYNWPAAIEACPSEWHLASNSDWNKLAEFISREKGPYEKKEDGWKGVGKHLKKTGNWIKAPADFLDDSALDDFSFSALPGGFVVGGEYKATGGYGGFWSSTTDSIGAPYSWNLHPFLPDLYFSSSSTSTGQSVRCVKD